MIAAKTSRDSGFGSGDPSPIHSQSPSGPSSLDNGHMANARRYFRSNSSPTANGARSKKKTSKRPSKWCLLLCVLYRCPDAHICLSKTVIIFSFINLNIYFGCSKELSH